MANLYGLSTMPNVSNSTSDPSTAHMRVFVGNLNTSAVTQVDIHNIFSKFGTVTGVSIHKGFAFVQYANERCARMAVMRTQNRCIAGQFIDVNIAAEPKQNQKPFSANGNSSNMMDGSFYNDDFSLPKTNNFAFGAAGANKNSSFGVRGGRVMKGKARGGNLALANNTRKRNSFNKQVFPAIKQDNEANPSGSETLSGVEIEVIRDQLVSIKSQVDMLLELLPKSVSESGDADGGDVSIKEEPLGEAIPTTGTS